MIDKQPEEVEAKLKAEMDRIMQRNIEVQNENRALKEEMDEMERELVNAKMSHAEVSPYPFACIHFVPPLTRFNRHSPTTTR